MPLLREIIGYLRQLAPEETAMQGDPVGLSINFGLDLHVHKVGVCLDISLLGAEAAVQSGVELVVAHHPLIFVPLKRLDVEGDPIARTVATLVSGQISFYGYHTNWDRASGGINDTLAGLLGLTNVVPLGSDDDADIARIGELDHPIPLPEFVERAAKALGCSGENALRYQPRFHDKTIHRVALCGGAGASMMPHAITAKADVFVTSDIRHHEFLAAAGLGLPILDAGHSATESPGMRTLQQKLADHFKDVEIMWIEH